jgi:hypothetical protein
MFGQRTLDPAFASEHSANLPLLFIAFFRLSGSPTVMKVLLIDVETFSQILLSSLPIRDGFDSDQGALFIQPGRPNEMLFREMWMLLTCAVFLLSRIL